MSTAPVTPAIAKPAVVATPQADVNAALVALAHAHASVSYWLIGVVVLVLALAGAGGYLGLRFADAQLARAEKMEATYDADRKAWQTELAASEAARSAATAQQQVIVKVIHDRDTTAAATIAQVTAPNQSLPDVESALRKAYGGAAPFDATLPLNGVYIETTANQVQQLTATAIDRDRLSGDLIDTQKTLALETTKTVSLTTDLSGCVSTLSESNKVIASYKSAAKLSRWRKFLGGAEKALILAGGIYIGHKL